MEVGFKRCPYLSFLRNSVYCLLAKILDRVRLSLRGPTSQPFTWPIKISKFFSSLAESSFFCPHFLLPYLLIYLGLHLAEIEAELLSLH